MPYAVKKQKGKYCVFNKETGENKGCSKTEEEAIAHMQAMAINEHMETLTSVMLEDNGPVIVGIAATNIPHLPLPPMSVVEVDGKQMVRVPFLRSGIFRHPNGKLIFNDQVFDKMLENHKAKKSYYGVSLNEKHRPGAALAWFDEERGGYIQKENDPEYGNLLIGYGRPTSDKTIDMIKNQEYVFASVEFNPKHQSNMIAKLSSDELEQINEEMLLEEEKMEEVTIALEELNALKEAANKVTELETKLAEKESKKKGKKAEDEEPDAEDTEDTPMDEEEMMKAKKAKKSVKEMKMEVEIPEEFKVQLEEQRNEIARLKKTALETQVDLVITRAQAYRDSNGYAHSPVVLEIAKAAMLGESITKSENEVIKLESGKPADVADYFRHIFVYMLETAPGTVRFEGKTTPDEVKSFNLGNGEVFTQDDFKNFWVERL